MLETISFVTGNISKSWINKQIVVDLYNRITHSNEGNTAFLKTWMNLINIMLSKRSQTQMTWLHLYKKQNQTKYDLLSSPLKVRIVVTITGDGRNRKRTWRQLLECWYGFTSQSYIYFFICKLYLSSVVLFLAISR